jgi:hypothetical protein
MKSLTLLTVIQLSTAYALGHTPLDTPANALTRLIRENGFAALNPMLTSGEIQPIQVLSEHRIAIIPYHDQRADAENWRRFGHETLKQIRASEPPPSDEVDEVLKNAATLLSISEWMLKRPAFGNYVIAHVAIDKAATSIAHTLIACEAANQDRFTTLLTRLEAMRLTPEFRAGVLDAELDLGDTFSAAVQHADQPTREGILRFAWKSLARDATLISQPISSDLALLARQAGEPVVSKEKVQLLTARFASAPFRPQPLNSDSIEVFERNNLWFAALVSEPVSVAECIALAKYARRTRTNLTNELRNAQDVEQLRERLSANLRNPTREESDWSVIAARVLHKVASGQFLERDQTMGATK